jgi:hypothetical protein
MTFYDTIQIIFHILNILAFILIIHLENQFSSNLFNEKKIENKTNNLQDYDNFLFFPFILS